MYKQEAITPYGVGKKNVQVEQMFDNIAPAYDTLNHRLSWNVDRHWRKSVVRQLNISDGMNILDIATGTGDMSIDMAKAAAKAAARVTITGTDLSEGMMAIGQEKVTAMGLDNIITFRREDALSMSFKDNTFDAITSTFGIRNFANLDAGLHEMWRVLKSGGRLCLAELTTPVRAPMRQLFKAYSHTILPAVGKIVSGDGAAYNYLTATIEAFPQGERMMDIMTSAGFRNCGFRRLTLGICTIYYATK